MVKRSREHHLGHWLWWQVVGAAVFGNCLFGGLIAFFPPISVQSRSVGIALGTLGIALFIWDWWVYSFWSRMAMGAVFTLYLVALAARCWVFLLPHPWIWAAPVLAAYLVAWIMPGVAPKLSDFLWQEQTTPQTRLGRILLAVALALGPSGGAIGASAGLFASRLGYMRGGMLVVGILFSVTAVGAAFAYAYQTWPDRPWAVKKLEADGGGSL